MSFIVVATANKHKVDEYKKLLGDIEVELKSRADFPDMPIYLCGVHRNLTRTEEREALIQRFDDWTRALVEATPNCFFIDPKTHEPLNRTDIFVKDGVHYNQEGYLLYADFFRSALQQELDKF